MCIGPSHGNGNDLSRMGRNWKLIVFLKFPS